MRIAYKWVRDTGPSEPDQDAMLRSAGFDVVDPARQNAYVDRPPKKRRQRGDDPTPALSRAIQAIHQGDVLVIPYPQCWAHTDAEARRKLAQLVSNGGALEVVSLGVTIATVPDMAPVLSFLAERAAPVMRERTERARTTKLAKQRAEMKRKVKEIEPLWSNPEMSVKAIERQTGHSRSTLYRWQREGLLPNARKVSR